MPLPSAKTFPNASLRMNMPFHLNVYFQGDGGVAGEPTALGVMGKAVFSKSDKLIQGGFETKDEYMSVAKALAGLSLVNRIELRKKGEMTCDVLFNRKRVPA